MDDGEAKESLDRIAELKLEADAEKVIAEAEDQEGVQEYLARLTAEAKLRAADAGEGRTAVHEAALARSSFNGPQDAHEYLGLKPNARFAPDDDGSRFSAPAGHWLQIHEDGTEITWVEIREGGAEYLSGILEQIATNHGLDLHTLDWHIFDEKPDDSVPKIETKPLAQIVEEIASEPPSPWTHGDVTLAIERALKIASATLRNVDDVPKQARINLREIEQMLAPILKERTS